MKYVLVLADGMADEKIKDLGDKTPLQCCDLPTVNNLAKQGEIGLVKTIPEGMSPGSDTANLSVMGYDPLIYHTGRSPLEAVSMGIELSDTDITFRCNLVTLSDEENYEAKTMIDNSAGEISSEEAAVLIQYINEKLGTDEIAFYPGVSYRHAMVWKNGPETFDLTPPHDILDKKIEAFLPKGDHSKEISEIMRKSNALIKDHPINQKRVKEGKKLANSMWIWGEGKKPGLDFFMDKYGLTGRVISAVDLVKGIGICAGLESVDVEGATGNIHTNFDGKAKAAIEGLERGKSFIYVHVEAPDECSHQGDQSGKIKSMELIDQKIVQPIVDYLDSQDEPFKILVLPDHPTPLSIRTHTSDPVPFVLYDSTKKSYNENNSFDEAAAEKSQNYFANGYELTDYFLSRD